MQTGQLKGELKQRWEEDNTTKMLQQQFVAFLEQFGQNDVSDGKYIDILQKLLHENEDQQSQDNNQINMMEDENLLLSNQLVGQSLRILTVDVDDLRQFPGTQTLVNDILDNIDISLKCLRAAVNELTSKLLNVTNIQTQYVDVRLSPTRNIREMSHLSGQDCGKYIAIPGTIVKAYQSRPALLSGSYICKNCSIEMQLEPNSGIEPHRCPQCQRLDVLALQMPKSVFEDVQRLRLQDDSGGVYRAIDVFLRGAHCGALRPGDKILASGYLTSVPVTQLTTYRASTLLKSLGKGYSIGIPKQGTEIQGEVLQNSARDTQLRGVGVQNTPGAYADTGARKAKEIKLVMVFQVVQIELLGGPAGSVGQLMIQNSLNTRTHAVNSLHQRQVLESALAKLGGRPDRLINSFLPSIQGLNDIKHAILLQQLGGVQKRTNDGTRLRADINILLVGDASVGKSLILREASRASSHGVYVSGRGATVAGLTAAVTKDTSGTSGAAGGWAVEAGALARADGGVCCIDEFDRIGFSDQSALHEAMEQQSITLAKAGVTATLRARAPVLAACSPVNGSYDRMKPLKRNVSVSAALLSRFDLVFVLTDAFDPENDAQLAQELLDVILGQKSDVELNQDEINAYIESSKLLKPTLSLEAQQTLQDTWVRLRQDDLKEAGLRDHRITVRQLESLIRLSEAQAKLERSQVVTPEHVQKAKDLVSKCIVDVVAPKEVFDVPEPQIPRHDGDASQRVNASANRSATGAEEPDMEEQQQRQIEISSQDLRKLAMILRFSVQEAGEEQFQGRYFLEVARLHLPLADAGLDATQKDQVYRQVLQRFLYVERWISEVPGEQNEDEEEQDFLEKFYFFTYLAPEV